MKTLYFIVDKDTIRFDESKDKVSDPEKLAFRFSQEWDGTAKVVKFTQGDKEYNPQILSYGTECYIPKEALGGSFFRIIILGRNNIKHLKTKPFIVNL